MVNMIEAWNIPLCCSIWVSDSNAVQDAYWKLLRKATSSHEVKSITLIRIATVFGPRGIFASQDKPLRPISRILSFFHAPNIKELVLRLGVTIRIIDEDLNDDPEPDNLYHIQALLRLLDKMGWRLLLDSLDPFTALRILRFDIVKEWCTGHNTIRYLEDAALDALEEWNERGNLRVTTSASIGTLKEI